MSKKKGRKRGEEEGEGEASKAAKAEAGGFRLVQSFQVRVGGWREELYEDDEGEDSGEARDCEERALERYGWHEEMKDVVVPGRWGSMEEAREEGQRLFVAALHRLGLHCALGSDGTTLTLDPKQHKSKKKHPVVLLDPSHGWTLSYKTGIPDSWTAALLAKAPLVEDVTFTVSVVIQPAAMAQ